MNILKPLALAATAAMLSTTFMGAAHAAPAPAAKASAKKDLIAAAKASLSASSEGISVQMAAEGQNYFLGATGSKLQTAKPKFNSAWALAEDSPSTMYVIDSGSRATVYAPYHEVAADMTWAARSAPPEIVSAVTNAVAADVAAMGGTDGSFIPKARIKWSKSESVRFSRLDPAALVVDVLKSDKGIEVTSRVDFDGLFEYSFVTRFESVVVRVDQTGLVLSTRVSKNDKTPTSVLYTVLERGAAAQPPAQVVQSQLSMPGLLYLGAATILGENMPQTVSTIRDMANGAKVKKSTIRAALKKDGWLKDRSYSVSAQGTGYRVALVDTSPAGSFPSAYADLAPAAGGRDVALTFGP